MAETISKNARRDGSKTEKFFHTCGGEIKMVSRYNNGKLVPTAVCSSCNASARKPRDLMVH
jgi:hypothetical protein